LIELVTYIHTYIHFISDKVLSTLLKIDRQTDNRNKMHKAKKNLNTNYIHIMPTDFIVFNKIVSAIDPLLTKRVLTIMYKSTKTRQGQFQKYGSNTMKFRIAKNI